MVEARTRSQQPGIGWWILGLAIFGVLVWIGLQNVGWIVFGLFTYYVARPISRRLQRHLPSRSLAAVLTLGLIVVPILVFVTAFLAIALGQILRFLSSETVEAVVRDLPFSVADLPSDPVETVVVILQDPAVTPVLDQFGVAVGVVATTLFNVSLVLILAFFLLTEDRRLAEWFETNVFGSESPSVGYLRGVDRGLTSVYFGYSLTIFAVIVLAAVIYTVFNLVAPAPLQIPTALLLAVVTGLFTLVPLVGRSVVYAFIVAFLALRSYDADPSLLWIPVAFYLFMAVVFDNVVRTYIRPSLSGERYHMGLVMFAYLLGPALFGWYGIFLGPLVMVVVAEFTIHILPRLARPEPPETGTEDELRDASDVAGSTPENGESPGVDSEEESEG
ncbi:AI-2E family transporter [Halobacterium wangiae]|uniref:AI-2E family transporter n=1 Tax=Halobacterium wangiae TaxID=2902623 RepID=UPI001E352379|nr:AI-2E family transporter [Halobacterium wangiae]